MYLIKKCQPHGIACGENVVKECEEEAGIPRSISSRQVLLTLKSSNVLLNTDHFVFLVDKFISL